ncbi:mucin-2-like [Neocloeon triangulifer]|uniref:mucin-2-like n=1 Tax=Neocloeon triangulifer TaxID=2078957 RepID=UPI00286F3E0A|nr:mucin-2-like [Neocloeon triangulifer]
MRPTIVLASAIVAAVLILDAAHARPSAEVALSGGYSYNPPNGLRLNYLPQRRYDSRARAAGEVTIERVPLRLVHQSIEQHHRPHFHVHPSGPARRGPFNFPTGRHHEPYQRFVFPSAGGSPFPRNDLARDQYQRNEYHQYAEQKNDFLKAPPPSAPSTGYTYDRPAVTLTTTEAAPVTTTTPEPTTTIPEHEKPRITIAISKSTVIHTGKGSYQIDEKTGKPKPIIAEAHSYAGLPEPSSTPKTVEGDNLTGEGTGNFPIITRGTPPKNEEPITESEDPITESEVATTTENSDTTTPNPANPSDSSPFSTSWPLTGQQSYSVIAPGQAQFVSLGHVNPGVVAFSQNNLVPAYIQPEIAHPTYRSAYHPFAPAATYYYQPYQHLLSPFTNFIEYAPSEDLCKGKVIPEAAAPAIEPVGKSDLPPAPVAKEGRLVITKGGIAIAGPGGIADSGEGGTSIVGPGGTAYSSPNGVSVVGPGGKVVMQADGTERILARGPIVYFHQA